MRIAVMPSNIDPATAAPELLATWTTTYNGTWAECLAAANGRLCVEVLDDDTGAELGRRLKRAWIARNA